MLANPQRGEADVTWDGHTYRFKLSMNVAVIVQHKTSKTFGALLKDASGLDTEAMRWLTWLLLQQYHAADFPTAESCGDFCDALGWSVLGEILTEIQRVNVSERPQIVGRNGNPQMGPTGAIGADSISKPAA